jgi:hypothetical protein
VGAFLVEFTVFESMYLEAAIGNLCTDAQLVSFAIELLELEDRLRLLKRLAEARKVGPVLMQDLTSAVRSQCALPHRPHASPSVSVKLPSSSASSASGV